MSDGRRLYGIQYDPNEDRSYPYWEQVYDYAPTPVTSNNRKTGQEALTRADQTPIDEKAAKVRQYDGAAFLAAEQAKAVFLMPMKMQVTKLPAVLNSVTVEFVKSAGSGSSDHPVADMELNITGSGSGSVDPRSSAQASASIVPVVYWSITNWYASLWVDAVVHEFIDAPGLTVAQIITRVGGGVTNFPVFKPVQHQLRLAGGQVSLQQTADSRLSVSFSDSSSSRSAEKGVSKSEEVGINVRVETIPETIHPLITLSPTSDDQDVTVTVSASVCSASGDASGGGISNEPAAETSTADASVAPTSLAATSGTTAIPTTGSYIVDIEPSRDELGTVRYRVFVVDFSQYA